MILTTGENCLPWKTESADITKLWYNRKLGDCIIMVLIIKELNEGIHTILT